MRSRSSVLGALCPCRVRPKSFSIASSFFRSDSGVSSGMGTMATAALTKGGVPGGQSTGSVRHNDERRIGPADRSASRSTTCNTVWTGLPMLAPMAIRANGGLRVIAFCSSRFFKAEHMLHGVKACWLTGHPTRCSQRAAGEYLAVGRFMGQFNALAVAGANHRVLAHNVTAA